MNKDMQDLGETIEQALPQKIAGWRVALGELTLDVKRSDLIDVLTFLRDDNSCQAKMFVDICGADYPEREERFEVIYHLLSVSLNHRIRVKVTTDEETAVPSATSVYPGAYWFEREAWDMYGIFFADHPDLRRLLTDYGFDGHPLRKDFPVMGYKEVRYDEAEKRVVYEPVNLMQDFRNFDFLSPWEGQSKHPLPGDEKAS